MDSIAEHNWRAWWPSQAATIAADIQARLPTAIAAWRLSRLEPLPGGEVALVFAATTPDGEAVLKLSPRVAGETDALADEGSALALWAHSGIAPRVLATRDDGFTLLLERVRPGYDLRQAGAVEIVETLGTLCPQVHVIVEPGRFQRLGEGSEAASWRRALAGTRELDELERLLIPTAEDRLLHTDLHWLNALRGPGGWMVIDPKPHVGDPHADVFAFFDGPPLSAMPDLGRAAREHVRRLTDVYARVAGLDRDRLEAWIRIRALAIVGKAGPTDGLGAGDAPGPAGPAGPAEGSGTLEETGGEDGSGGIALTVSDRHDDWRERLLRLADTVV